MRLLWVALVLAGLHHDASARPGAADLTDWLQVSYQGTIRERSTPAERAARLDRFLPAVKPKMSVSQVLTLLGPPDVLQSPPWWKSRQRQDPRNGILKYSTSGSAKSGPRTVLIYFDGYARVDRIVENGVVLRQAPTFFRTPLPRGVWWRK